MNWEERGRNLMHYSRHTASETLRNATKRLDNIFGISPTHLEAVPSDRVLLGIVLSSNGTSTSVNFSSIHKAISLWCSA